MSVPFVQTVAKNHTDIELFAYQTTEYSSDQKLVTYLEKRKKKKLLPQRKILLHYLGLQISTCNPLPDSSRFSNILI